MDLLVRLPHEEDMHLTDFVKAVCRRFQVMSEYIREQGETQITRNAHGYEGNPEDWKPGTLVWYFLPCVIPGKPKKLTNQWLGPWVVVEKLAPVLVKVKPANSKGEERIVHSSRLRLYQGKDGRSRILPQPLYIDEDEDDEPNVIRAAPGAAPGGSAAAAVAPAWIPTGAAPPPILSPPESSPPASNLPASNSPAPQPPAFNPPAQMDVEVTDEVVPEDSREVTMEDVERPARGRLDKPQHEGDRRQGDWTSNP